MSTDGKHWWEYVDDQVTIQLLDELTHEFLQILEKTPSRLKRIRNWRATQAAKKPRTESSLSSDPSSAAGPSSLLHPPFEPPSHTEVSSELGPSRSSLPSTSSAAFLSSSHGDWSQSRPEHIFHPPTPANLPTNPPTVHKLSLDKYREKHKQEQGSQEVYSASTAPKGNRKQEKSHQRGHNGGGDNSVKKTERRHHGDRNKKDKELKGRIRVPSSLDGHSSSDESTNNGSRSRHSSPARNHSGNGHKASDGSEVTGGGSRKRAYPEPGQNHYTLSSSSGCSKVSKLYKSGPSPAGGLRGSQLFPSSSESPHEVGEHRH